MTHGSPVVMGESARALEMMNKRIPEVFVLEEAVNPLHCQCNGGQNFWRSQPPGDAQIPTVSKDRVRGGNGEIRKWKTPTPSISGSPPSPRDVLPVISHCPWAHGSPIVGGTGKCLRLRRSPKSSSGPIMLASVSTETSRSPPL